MQKTIQEDNRDIALRKWFKMIKKNQGGFCQICGSKEGLASHHIIHKSKYPGLELNENNGIALCKKHHGETHLWNVEASNHKHHKLSLEFLEKQTALSQLIYLLKRENVTDANIWKLRSIFWKKIVNPHPYWYEIDPEFYFG